MLVDFTVENFRSYREPKRFSLKATSAAELPDNKIAVSAPEIELLRTAAIYGSNASGKSNLLAAMYCLSELLESPFGAPYPPIYRPVPFALDRASKRKATKFEVRFIVEGVLYDYSAAFHGRGVESESLVAHPLGRPQQWFMRTGKEFEFNRTYLKGPKNQLLDFAPQEALFLGVALKLDHPQLSPPARWLVLNLRDRIRRFPAVGGRSDATTALLLEDEQFVRWANGFLKHADLGIQSIAVESFDVEVRRVRRKAESQTPLFPSEERKEKRYEPYFVHSGEDDVQVRFGLGEESLGTRRLFGMLAPLYEVFTKQGQLAVIDELSASVHPSMVREVIRLFHDTQVNKGGSQLIFATHDTSLLSGEFFRRDQVWFTEKSPLGVTDLYSLHDIKGVRADDPFEKGYLRGRYGAIPFFGKFDFPETEETTATTVEEETKPNGDGVTGST